MPAPAQPRNAIVILGADVGYGDLVVGRKGNWKLVTPPNAAGRNCVNGMELFDLSGEIEETKSVTAEKPQMGARRGVSAGPHIVYAN